jgi:hypothetical protein
MDIEQFIVWAGDIEVGQYDTEEEAYEVCDELVDDGYQNVEVDEVMVDNETPEQMNAWLRDGGF